MRRFSAVVIALALALAPACAKASAQERIAQAATKTQEAESARFAMTMEMTGGAQEISVDAEGAMEFASQKVSMTIHLGEMGAQAGMEKLEMLAHGQTIYMKFPNHEQMQLPTPWLKIDLASLTGVPGMESLSQLNNNDPSKTMEMLRGVSENVEEVGTEDVRGSSTTHYKATLDLDKAVEQVPEKDRKDIQKMFDDLGTNTIPTEVWIDDEGLLRRQKSTIDLSQAKGAGAAGGGAPTGMVMDMELYDFGAAVDVEPPPPDQTTDFATLQQGGGG